MMNTMIKKSPNQVSPVPRRNNEETRDEEIDNENGIIYPPEYSVASPIPMNDPNSLPLAPAVLIEEHNTHNAEEGRLPTQNSEESDSKKPESRFDPFRPIHPQCNHISYGCLTMVFIVFVGMAVLLKTYLPGILPPSNDESVIPYPSVDDEDLKSYNSYQPSSPRPTAIRSNSPSMYPSHPPSIARYEEIFVASDGSNNDYFGRSCSMSNELVLIGATEADEDKGAAYLFHLNGTEVKKLSPVNDLVDKDGFGYSVAIDEKIVVGTNYHNNYFEVFSRDGIYERTIRCNDCSRFGDHVATLGNLMVTSGYQNYSWKLYIYKTDGELLKVFDQFGVIWDVVMSEQFIVVTASYGTFILSNTSPDFPEIAMIFGKGWEVAVSGDRIVIGNRYANDNNGAAYLYKTDGTLVKTLDRQDASSGSSFGSDVAITDDKVIVGAKWDDDQGYRSGSVFIYSAVTGEFLEKVVAPDGKAWNWFGSSVCTSDLYYIVGAYAPDSYTGTAYLFQLP